MGHVYLSPPDVGPAERAALLRAFDSGWVAPAGPELAAFESELASLADSAAVVALSSGTAALHLALLVSGVEPGDEVAVSDLTFAATANAVRYCGATPVFVDSERISWNMSPELLTEYLASRRRRGRLPAAVVAVDLYGQCADYDEIAPQCRELDIPLIEDAAEAISATYKGRPAGTLGDHGVFSFNGNKIMTTSGGGAFVSSDVAAADQVRYLATQARQPVAHYEHEHVGFNYRMSNLLAALGRAQLERVPEMSRRRLEINSRYRAELVGAGVEFMPTPEWTTWNGWLTCVLFDDGTTRDRVMAALADRDIESRPLWKPMHLQPVYRDCEAYVDGTSDDLFGRGLCLPSGSALTDDEVSRVSEIVRAAAGD